MRFQPQCARGAGASGRAAFGRGFTLIELMITVAIVAILARIAVPAYTSYITRGRIPDATSNLAANQVKMEQWFQDNRSYLNTAGTACGGVAATDTTSSRYFTLSCAATTQTFTLTATGTGSMNGFVYTVTQTGAKATTGVPSGWATSSTCWITKKGGQC